MTDYFTLENGIRCIVKKIDGVRSCSAGVFVKVGSADETKEENGISHFIEHVNFKGTDKRSSFQISWDSDSLGIILNAATAKETTYYYTKTISEHLDEAFDILSDLFINSNYPAGELDKERGVVVEEINMYEDTPDDVCTTELSGAYYGNGNGYGRTILGTKKNVLRFTRDDVFAYKKKYYTTDNIVLCFVGDVTKEKAYSLANEKFGAILPSTSAKRIKRNLTPRFGKTVRAKDIEQAHLALAFPAVGLNDDRYLYYDFIANVLGGGMSSRLFQRVREELGLCYNVYSYQSLYSDSGTLCVYAGLNGDKLKEAFDAVFDEIRKLKSEGVKQSEFDLVREQIKSSLVFAQESTSSQMTLFGRKLVLSGERFDFDERLKTINSMKLSTLNEYLFDRFDIDRFAVSTVAKQGKNDI